MTPDYAAMAREWLENRRLAIGAVTDKPLPTYVNDLTELLTRVASDAAAGEEERCVRAVESANLAICNMPREILADLFTVNAMSRGCEEAIKAIRARSEGAR